MVPRQNCQCQAYKTRHAFPRFVLTNKGSTRILSLKTLCLELLARGLWLWLTWEVSGKTKVNASYSRSGASHVWVRCMRVYMYAFVRVLMDSHLLTLRLGLDFEHWKWIFEENNLIYYSKMCFHFSWLRRKRRAVCRNHTICRLRFTVWNLNESCKNTSHS